MSLLSTLRNAQGGLSIAEKKANLISNNIAKSDKPGYTKKTYEVNYRSTAAGTVIGAGTVRGSMDAFLAKALYADNAAFGRTDAMARIMDSYARLVATTDDGSNMTGYLNQLSMAFKSLESDPSGSAYKSQVIEKAQLLAFEVRSHSAAIQDQRLQADRDIESTIELINTYVRNIHNLNDQINIGTGRGQDVTELEDERWNQLELLSELTGVNHSFNDQGRMQLYLSGGRPLLLSEPYAIQYQAQSIVNSTVVHPGGFNNIVMHGADVTLELNTGRLGGLLAMRDTVLVQEQQKLDEFTSVMMDTINGTLNTGTTFPPQNTLTGTVLGLAAGNPFSGTGTLRVAVTDNSGVVQQTVDLNLALYATLGDLVTALDGVPGVDANIVGGQLVVNAINPAFGVSFNATGTLMTPSNYNVLQEYGMQNLFSGTNSEDININNDLLTNPARLATVTLRTGPLAIGDAGILVSDASIIQTVLNVFDNPVAFAAAGNFSAQNNTLGGYASAMLGDVAIRTSSFASDALDDGMTVESTRSELVNKVGVSIDEENADLVFVQNLYNSNAQIIRVVREMFDTLLDAVR